MPDPIFADPRLAQLYDVVDDDRRDLDVYVEIVRDLTASTVLDVGCGTGTLACELARRGIEVIGVDPAAASLAVARRKPGAEHVRWIHGDAASVPPFGVDLAVMTGNVAQVFIGDANWAAARLQHGATAATRLTGFSPVMEIARCAPTPASHGFGETRPEQATRPARSQ